METSSSPSCGFSHNPLHKHPSWLNDVTELLWLCLPSSTPHFLHLFCLLRLQNSDALNSVHLGLNATHNCSPLLHLLFVLLHINYLAFVNMFSKNLVHNGSSL